jgi:hypothetical protein
MKEYQCIGWPTCTRKYFAIIQGEFIGQLLRNGMLLMFFVPHVLNRLPLQRTESVNLSSEGFLQALVPRSTINHVMASH